MLYLPRYFEENPPKLNDPLSEWYLGEDLLANLPKLSDHIGKLDKNKKDIILKYMKNANVLSIGFPRKLEFDNFPVNDIAFSDGTYIWTDAHIHYVNEYSLELPCVFLNHIYSYPGYLTDGQKRNIKNYKLESQEIIVNPDNLKELWKRTEHMQY